MFVRMIIKDGDMARNLDLTALRSFAMVAETGGVTRAAGLLNLTQSAVSMQIRRLEESLDLALFSRVARRLVLTAEGEQLLGYARRMLETNDEALARLTCASFEGEIRLGVPYDIVYPQIPGVLQRLATLYPRMRINLVSSFTMELKAGFARGDYDVILTTEEAPDAGGETLAERSLRWIGAPGGTAWQRRPLRLGFEERCLFRAIAQTALDRAGIPWEMAFTGQSERVMEATTAADLALTARIDGAMPEGCVLVPPEAGLPSLGTITICLYHAERMRSPMQEAVLDALRCAYGTCEEPVRLRA